MVYILENINKSQLYAILISIRLFEHICSMDMYCRNQMLGVLISVIFQVVMIVLIFMFNSKTSIFEKIQSSRILSYIYVICLVLYGGISLNRIALMDNVIPKTITGVVCILLFGITCIYCARLNIKALARSSLAVMFIVVISFVILIYGVTSNMDISNVYYNNDEYNILYYALSDFSKNIDLIFLSLLIDTSYTRKQAFKYLGLKLLSVEVLSLIGLCVLGGTGIISQFSFIDLASYSQPFGIKRTDSLYILVSTLVCVLNISLCLILSSKLLHNTLGKHKEIVLTIFMIIVSYLISNMDITVILSIMILMLSCIIPAMLNLAGDFEAQSKEGFNL